MRVVPPLWCGGLRPYCTYLRVFQVYNERTVYVLDLEHQFQGEDVSVVFFLEHRGSLGG